MLQASLCIAETPHTVSNFQCNVSIFILVVLFSSTDDCICELSSDECRLDLQSLSARDDFWAIFELVECSQVSAFSLS
jgi:hypothetical protein